MQHLERHRTVVLEIVGQVDRRHPAATDLPLQIIAVAQGGLQAIQDIDHWGYRGRSRVNIRAYRLAAPSLDGSGQAYRLIFLHAAQRTNAADQGRAGAAAPARPDEAAGHRPAGVDGRGLCRHQHPAAAVRLAGIHPGPGRGVPGGRHRGLVRDHRPLPPPAQYPDPPHRHHPQPQGSDRTQSGQLRAEQLPVARGPGRQAPSRRDQPAGRRMAARAGERPHGAAQTSPRCSGAPAKSPGTRTSRRCWTAAWSSRSARCRSPRCWPKGLALLTVDDRHQQLLDRVIHGLTRLVAENESPDPREDPGGESLVGAEMVDDRIHRKVLGGIERTLFEVGADPDHPLRRQFDELLAEWIVQLQSHPKSSPGPRPSSSRSSTRRPAADWRPRSGRELKEVLGRQTFREDDRGRHRRVARGLSALARSALEDERCWRRSMAGLSAPCFGSWSSTGTRWGSSSPRPSAPGIPRRLRAASSCW